MVRFTWDARKSETNLQVRGFDFAVASLIFGGSVLERRDARRDYGEERVIAIGVVNDTELTVVYTDRPGESGIVERRIISARRSNRRERQEYRKTLQAGP